LDSIDTEPVTDEVVKRMTLRTRVNKDSFTTSCLLHFPTTGVPNSPDMHYTLQICCEIIDDHGIAWQPSKASSSVVWRVVLVP
jgi:hypothetical protein